MTLPYGLTAKQAFPWTEMY